jgi:cytosine/adenosine deaminase-related metal-dependent hydrolase
MLLSSLNIIGQAGKKTVRIEQEKIIAITDEKPLDDQNEFHLSFENAIVFPGLINSHDHLDFNLFPQLGNRVYKNYGEWGEDIHQSHKRVIEQILAIPKQLRRQWGTYKNILCGVTTVVDHGGDRHKNNDLITVYDKAISFHSMKNSGRQG